MRMCFLLFAVTLAGCQATSSPTSILETREAISGELITRW